MGIEAGVRSGGSFSGVQDVGGALEAGEGARISGDAQGSWREGKSGQRKRAACHVGGFIWSGSEEKAREAPSSAVSRLLGAERGRPGKKEGVSNLIR